MSPTSDSKTGSNSADGFLSAEAAARELVEKLKELDEARSAYASAKKDLQESFGAAQDKLTAVADQIVALSAEVSETGRAVARSIEVVRSISGPAIMAEVLAGKEETAKRLAPLQSMGKELQALTAGQEGMKGSINTSLAGISRTAGYALYASMGALLAVLCTLVVVLVR